MSSFDMRLQLAPGQEGHRRAFLIPGTQETHDLNEEHRDGLTTSKINGRWWKMIEDDNDVSRGCHGNCITVTSPTKNSADASWTLPCGDMGCMLSPWIFPCQGGWPRACSMHLLGESREVNYEVRYVKIVEQYLNICKVIKISTPFEVKTLHRHIESLSFPDPLALPTGTTAS